MVYYTALGDDAGRRRSRAGLESAKVHLRSVLGRQVRMKFTPEVSFQEDVGLTHVERISQLLKQIEVESKGAPTGEDPADEEDPAGAGAESKVSAE
jgi:ribosome-binding factor A